ncbi:MAG: hypothetical protein QXI19_10185, partial [Candidatus Caldarchaeum sp.]
MTAFRILFTHAGWFILVGAFSIYAFSAPQARSMPTQEGHREVFQDPPRPRPPAPPNYPQGGIITWGSFVSVQVNVDAQGRNIPGDAANEPSIIDILSADKEFGWTSNFDGFRPDKRSSDVALYYGRAGKRLVGGIARKDIAKSPHLI